MGRATAGMEPVSVRIETHGCKLNAADSQTLARRFLGAGYRLAANSTPDVYVLNSCTVTHVADRKARHALASARRRYPGALVVAAGCLSERLPDDVGALRAVDLVVPVSRRDRLVEIVSERLGNRAPRRGSAAGVGAQRYLLGRTRADVKIQEGCDQACAYCVVPGVRGPARSVPVAAVVTEVARLVRDGCSEAILTGTRPGSYGQDLGTNLGELLRAILGETDVPRLRVSSLQPPEIGAELLGLWTGAGRGRLCPHFHMPLQSGSDAVLTSMRRRYTVTKFAETAERVRQVVPDVAITTDLIAGFPDESESDHRASMETMEQVRFAAAHVFPYSRRPDTFADSRDGHLPPATKARRAAELRELAARHAGEYRRRFVGTVRPVLWEGAGGETGLTDNYLRVRREDDALDLGMDGKADGDGVLEEVELVALEGAVLVGRPT